MDRIDVTTTRRPQGVVAKPLTQQPSAADVAAWGVGNQKTESDDDAPERVDDSEEERPSVQSFSIATPPSSPENLKCEDVVSPEASAEDSDTSRDDESITHVDASAEHDQQQLESDVEVLAAHVQQQTRALEYAHSVNESLQAQLTTIQATLTRENDGLRIENDALRHQNALVVTERDASVLHAQTVSETHDELLRALRTQQQREDHARTIIATLVKERDTIKRQLDESKTYCRRLEEDAVTLRAEQQHLRMETTTLETALNAATSHRNHHEQQLLRDQAQLIESLRADLLQMEFEFKTLSVDKDHLSRRVATLQRQTESCPTSYDVISLHGDAKSKDKKKKKRLSVSTAKDNKNFTNLLTLPNCIDDRTSSVVTSVPRPRTPMGSLVSKTLTSAKKKLFQSSSHTSTVVLPQ